jgi:hypothetical protein
MLLQAFTTQLELVMPACVAELRIDVFTVNLQTCLLTLSFDICLCVL